ncbi:MAG: adenylyltransferase/cytidyltransferase family protein [Nanoarchaeota archaeon]
MTVALFLGRFQPFHNGHLWAVRKILKTNKNILIVLGSSQGYRTQKDPFSVSERRRMVAAALGHAGIKRFSLHAVPDIPQDSLYVKHVETRVPAFDRVYSGNSLVLRLFKRAGYPVVKLDIYRNINATAIRARLLKRKAVSLPPPIGPIVKKLFLESSKKRNI